MKLLLVKTSSLGDILHTLPALTDLATHHPEIRIHWVVEEGFAQIPTWSHSVEAVIPIALRRWRKEPLTAFRSGEVSQFFQQLRTNRYAMILDAQGLLKSALVAFMGHGERYGLDRHSAREPLASLFYNHTVAVPTHLHAVERLRRLFAQTFNLPAPTSPIDFGLTPSRFTPNDSNATPYLLFLHGTTWRSKEWPESHWLTLAQQAEQAGMQVRIPWGNSHEYERANRIQAAAPKVCQVLPKLTLEQLATQMAHAQAAIATDSGPAHLAAALGTPTVGLYGPTDKNRIGIVGSRTQLLSGHCPLAPCRQRICPLPPRHANAPQPACLASLEPKSVWQTLEQIA